jgi:hypothetical protein
MVGWLVGWLVKTWLVGWLVGWLLGNHVAACGLVWFGGLFF